MSAWARWPFREIEVVRADVGCARRCVLHGAAARRWPSPRGVRRWLVTLSHTDHLAQAVVVALALGSAGAADAVIPIVTPEEMGAIDRAAPEPVEVLIGRAGAAVARAAVDMLGGTYGRRVVVLAGKGNNGNDGREAARRLRRPRACGSRVVDVADGARSAPAVRPRDRRRLRHRVPRAATGAPASSRARRCWRSTSRRGRRAHRRGRPGRRAARPTAPSPSPRSSRACCSQPGAELCGEVDGGRHRSRRVAAPRAPGRATPTSPAGCPDAAPSAPQVAVAPCGSSAGSPGHGGCGRARGAGGACGPVPGYVRWSAPGGVPSARRSRSRWWRSTLPRDGLGRRRCSRTRSVRGARRRQRPRRRRRALAGEVREPWSRRAPVARWSSTPTALTAARAGRGRGRRADDGAHAARRRVRPAGRRARPAPIASPPPGTWPARLGCVVLLKGPTTVVAEPDGQVLAGRTAGDARLATLGTGDVLAGVIGGAVRRRARPVPRRGGRSVPARSGRRPRLAPRPRGRRPARPLLPGSPLGRDRRSRT